jgi:hypothetical protein
LRLVGIGFAQVVRQSYTQGELFDSKAQRTRRVEQTVSRLRGASSGPRITKASLLDQPPRRSGEPA